MKYGGLTTVANIFTDSEYNELSLKLGLLFMQLLTVLMIFYGGHGKKYFKDETRKKWVTAAGICGMVYASSALVDCFVRLKYKSIRIFDEISLLAAGTCLWLLVYILFEKLSLPFVGAALLLIVFGLGVATRKSNGNIKGGKINPRVKEIILELSQRGDPNDILKLAALMVLLNKPEDPEAEEFYDVVIAAHLHAANNKSQSDSAKNDAANIKSHSDSAKKGGLETERKSSDTAAGETPPSTGVNKAAAKSTAGNLSTNV